MGDFIRKNLEGIAEKICNINNKCLGITEDDLNPEIPLSNLEE